MDEFSVEKNALRTRQKTELKKLQKDLKKKKGSQKETLLEEIREMEITHEEELTALDTKHGRSKKKDKPSPASPPAVATSAPVEKFEVRDWSSMSKKALEEHCSKWGLGKTGSREDLVTKLVIYSQSMGSKNISSANELDAEAASVDVPVEDDEAAFMGSGTTGDHYDASEIQHAGPKNRMRGRKLNKRGRGRGAGRGGFSRPVGEEEEEIPEQPTDPGKIREELEESSAGGEEEEEVEMTEEQVRMVKRQTVMRSVLKEIMRKNPNGFALDELDDQLKKLKVSNFNPALLGFDTVEDWLDSQPESLIYFDKEESRILPP